MSQSTPTKHNGCAVSLAVGVEMSWVELKLLLCKVLHSTIIITVCTVVQNCCKGDEPYQWKTPIFRPSRIENPWTDRHQIWQGWLRQGLHPTCKLWYFYPQGGGCTYVWNCHHPCLFFYTPLLFYSLHTCRDRTVWPIFVFYGSKDVFRWQLRPFWGANKIFNNFHYFSQKNAKFPIPAM